ncbi:MAG: hypothetical protein HYX24_00955 [Candidatus Aenigmarchaeota archaeon]|nr:hypothetical protein [Candidatus Aenigmarchaeota archaeon]
MSETFVLAGILLIFIGIFLVLIGSMMQASKTEGKVSVGIGGFIGPIPFGFSNSKEMLYMVIAVSMAALLVFLLAPKP